MNKQYKTINRVQKYVNKQINKKTFIIILQIKQRNYHKKNNLLINQTKLKAIMKFKLIPLKY